MLWKVVKSSCFQNDRKQFWHTWRNVWKSKAHISKTLLCFQYCHQDLPAGAELSAYESNSDIKYKQPSDLSQGSEGRWNLQSLHPPREPVLTLSSVNASRPLPIFGAKDPHEYMVLKTPNNSQNRYMQLVLPVTNAVGLRPADLIKDCALMPGIRGNAV